MSTIKLIVAEGHWKNHTNHSVKSLFDLLSDLVYGSTHSYKYVQFADATAFDANVNGLADGKYEYLYIGSHGDKKSIQGFSATKPLSKTIICNRLSGISGLYLGACEFGQPSMLTDILSISSDLSWCAGYKRKVNWIDSSLLDLAFWKTYMKNAKTCPQLSPDSLISNTLNELQTNYASLILSLGFNVAVRQVNDQGQNVVTTFF